MATISARIDDQLKASAEAIAESIGIPLSTVINVFLKRFVHEKGFPFELKAVEEAPPAAEDVISSLEEKVRQAISDTPNNGIPSHFTYLDPKTKNFITCHRKE